MANFELVKTLKQSLDILGCEQSIIMDIDHHSTIELNFADLPNMMLSQIEDSVVLWSRVAPYRNDRLIAGATEIIEPLTDVYDWAANGQIQLLKSDDFFELRVLLNDFTLQNAEALALALEQFFQLVQQFSRVLD